MRDASSASTSSRSRVALAAVLASGVLSSGVLVSVAGCGERIELVGTRDAAPPSCTPTGVACREAADCCSGVCFEGLCDPSECRPIGAACRSPRQCCGGTCSAGFCATHVGCRVIGESCSASSECCSAACALSASGRVECQELDGCRPGGEICARDSDCCEAANGPGACVIFDAESGLGLCRITTSCLAPGEPCGGLASCCGGMGRCHATSIPHLDRCLLESTPGSGLEDGSPCASGADCRSELCGAVGVSEICLGTCLAGGLSCARGSDCCSGRCIESRCAIDTGCRELGRVCSSAGDCCSQLCDSSGRCGAPS